MADPLAPSALITGLRSRLRDTAGTNRVFTDKEMLDALTDAAQAAHGKFWADGVYDSLVLTVNQRDYALPGYIRRVRKVERELLNYPSGAASNYVRWQDMHHWQHVPGQQTNYLVVDTPQLVAERARVYYEADLPVTFFQATQATSVVNTATFIAYSSGDIPIWQWPVPGYLRVGNEIIGYGAVQHSPEGFGQLQRGLFGSGPATASTPYGLTTLSAAVIEPVWMQDFAPARDFLIQKAMHFLYLQRLNTGDTEGNKTVAALAAEWGKIAQDTLNHGQQRHLPRSVRTARQGR